MLKTIPGKINSVIAICLFLFLISCNSENVVFSETFDVRGDGWQKDSIACFEFPVTDTSSVYAIRLSVDNTDDYRYANMFVFTSIRFPSDTTMKDTVNLVLSDYKGNWTGENDGGDYRNVFAFKNNVKFPETGMYSFCFEQAMRSSDSTFRLNGISSLTFDIIEYSIQK